MTDDRQGVPTRRRYLAMLGAGTLSTGAAGCLGRDSGGDGGGETSGETNGGSAGGGTAGGGSTPETSTAGLDPCLRPASASTCESPVSVGGTVAADTTWGGDCDEYRVTDSVTVENGATLTVAPNTRVVFAQNTELEIEEDGALSAVGSCGEPIVFTGEQATRGYWDGIHFYQADQMLSELAYCVVEYGGGDRFTYSSAVGNVVLTDGARVSVTNSLVRESAGFGVALDSNVTVDAFTENVLTANASGAAYCHAPSAHYFSDTSRYSGNDADFVGVYDGTVGSAVTWDAIDVPYRVSSGSDVTVQGHLTVAPGATIEFGQDCALLIDDTGPGRLTAVGIDPQTEESRPITFTGEQQTRGYWDGIQFYESDRTENRLYNCVVEYGGGDRFTYAGVPANVVVIDGSRVRIDNTTVRESAGYAVELDGGSTLETFAGNTLAGNAAGAVHTHPASAGDLDGSSTYSGNDTDRVAVYEGTIGANTDLTWDAIDVPYYVVSDGGVTVRGHLTVEPGTTVEMGQDTYLTMDDNGPGRLTADGGSPDSASSAPITFTGEQQTRGYWQGIQFFESNRTENRLHNCVIEYGGGEKFIYAQQPANVALVDGSRLSLQHSTVRESAGYAVDVDGDSTLTEANNAFEDNAAGGIDY